MNNLNFLLPTEVKDKIISTLSKDENADLINSLNSLDIDNKWSDYKKWWTDLGKSIIVWGLVIFVTLKYLNKIDDDRNNARYRYQKMTELEINSINSFKQTSQTYLFVGYDIYNKKDTNQLTYKNFKSLTYDQMHTDIKDLKRYFKDNDRITRIDSFDNRIQILFKNYINPTINKTEQITNSGSFNEIYDTLYRLRTEIVSQAMETLFSDKK